MEDLRLLFNALRPASDKQEAITIEDLSRLTGLQEVKVRVGLAELERAGALEHPGDEGLRMQVKLRDWRSLAIQAVTDRLGQHQAHRKAQLSIMIAYAESDTCRRRIILSHFGDSGPAEADVCCDNCQAGQLAPTAASPVGALSQSERVALIVLDTVHRLRREVGIEKIAQILKGSKAKDIMQFSYDKNTYYGRLAVYSLADLKRIVGQLCEMRYLKVIGGKYPVLHLPPLGEAAIRDKTAIHLKLPRQVGIQAIERKKAERQAGGSKIVAATIIDCVNALPGKLPRSGVAKLLVGSRSDRVSSFRHHPMYNQLENYSRSEVMSEVDRLLTDGQLGQDDNGYLIPGNNEEHRPSKAKIPIKVEIQRVVALGNSRSPSAIPELAAYLRNSDGNIRRLAASALGKIANKQATKPLLELLSREEKPQVRQYAVIALGLIEDVSAKPLLETIAHDFHEKTYTRKAAENSLQRLLSIKKDRSSPCRDKPTAVESIVARSNLSLPFPSSSTSTAGIVERRLGVGLSQPV